MRTRQEYLDTLRFVQGYKEQYGYKCMGWQSVIDSIEILFDSHIVKVRFRVIEGTHYNHDADLANLAYVIKGPYELIYGYYTSLVPDGFSVWFEHDGTRDIINSYSDLRAKIDRYNDMWSHPNRY